MNDGAAPAQRPGRRPRLIGVDVDGTLADRGRISDRVRNAVGTAVRGGATVVLSTARTVVDTRPVLMLLAVPGVRAVCSNGAVHLDAAGRVTRCQVFQPREAVAVLRDLLEGVEFAMERVGTGDDVTAGLTARGGTSRRVVTDAQTLVAQPVPRMAAWWPGHTQAELAQRMAGVHLPGAHYVLDHEYPWLFASPPGVTKGAALEELRRELRVDPIETMAVGDGFNDIEMLRWAARSVAMGQAPEQVRASAVEVADTVGRDGLAVVLERWFGSRSEWGEYQSADA